MTARQVFQNTVVFISTFVAAYVLLLGIRILIDLLLAILIASALRPLVTRLEHNKIPTGLAILLVYSTLILIIITTLFLVFPPLVDDGVYYLENDKVLAKRIFKAQTRFENSWEDFTHKDIKLLSAQEIENSVGQVNRRIHQSLPDVLNNFSNTIGEMLIIVVMGAYWLTSRAKAIDFVSQLFSPQYRIKVENIIDEIEYSLGGYMRGTVAVGFVIGSLNALIMAILGVPNTPVLGLMIGLATMIPMIGGVLGTVLAVLATLIISPEHVLMVAATAFTMQLVENYVVSPNLMSRSVNIDPLMVITYSLIGFALYGVIGALIAVPVMRTIHILLNYLVIDPHKSNIRLFRIENGMIIMNPPVEPVVESQIEIAQS